MENKEVIEIRGHHLPAIADYFYIRKKTERKKEFDNEKYLDKIMDSEYLREVGYTREFKGKILSLCDKLYGEEDYKVKLISGKLDAICNLDCPVKDLKNSEEYKKKMFAKYLVKVRECDSKKPTRKDNLFIFLSGMKKDRIYDSDEFKQCLEKRYWLLRFGAIYLSFL